MSRFGKDNPSLALAALQIATQNATDPDGKSINKSNRAGSRSSRSKRGPPQRKRTGGG